MFLEAVVGLHENSLALISDAGHMLFDCIAVAIGLYGAVLARLPRDERFPFGQARGELVCGFANSLLLLLAGLSVILEALRRLLEQPVVNDRLMLPVSVLGLLVNVSGLFLFREHYFSGGCGQVHARGNCGGDNLRAVFLHVLADAMGSCAAIASGVLLRCCKWRLADPLCSLITGTLIVASVAPMLPRVAGQLLLQAPEELRGPNALASAFAAVPGVVGTREAAFWSHAGAHIVGMVTVLTDTGDLARIASDVRRMLRQHGVTQAAVQVDKCTGRGGRANANDDLVHTFAVQ